MFVVQIAVGGLALVTLGAPLQEVLGGVGPALLSLPSVAVAVLCINSATWSFTGWSGCDAVSGATCTVSMNAPRLVIATFTLQTFTLSVSKASLLIGVGTVTSSSNPASPDQIDCGPTCSASYGYGTVVTLTATPGFLSIFDSWNGCDTVSDRICTVTVHAARSVTANFLP